MDKEWRFVEPSRLTSSGKIVIPEQIKQKVQRDALVHGTKGASVCWNYDRHSHFIVLSQEPLSNQDYESVARTKIFREEKGDYTTFKIRPPSGLIDIVSASFQEGGKVFFLAYDDMVAENTENRSVHLLSNHQLLRILPQNRAEDTIELKERVLNQPRLLPRL